MSNARESGSRGGIARGGPLYIYTDAGAGRSLEQNRSHGVTFARKGFQTVQVQAAGINIRIIVAVEQGQGRTPSAGPESQKMY